MTARILGAFVSVVVIACAGGGGEPGEGGDHGTDPGVEGMDPGLGEAGDATEATEAPEAGAEVPDAPQPACTPPCDDGRPCTSDTCLPGGRCAFAVMAGWCLVDGVCHAHGTAGAGVPCRVCDAAGSPTAWSFAPDGTACDPSSSLGKCEAAVAGVCLEGTCKATGVGPRSCDDSDPCTSDSCDPAFGCRHAPRTGGACTVASACLPGECIEGKCIVPAGASCDDGLPCTEDSCAGGQCAHVPLSGVPCPADACALAATCVQGACVPTPVNCNDGNVCTVDGCDPVTGCWHDLATNECCVGGVSICDDGDPCTDDLCEPGSSLCQNVPNTAACDDGDPCTTGDSCLAAVCAGTPKPCDDHNDCTLDSCAGGKCVHAAVLDDSPCDDGLACSTGDACKAGLCVADKSGCACVPELYPASKVTSLSMATTGNPGDGLDLDEDPTTCQPAGCSGGVDNALGKVAGLPVANDALMKSLQEGDLIMLFEHRHLSTDGATYTLAFHRGELDPAAGPCDFQKSGCDYLVLPGSFDTACNPLVSLDNARIQGGKLTAGGKGYTFPFDIPLAGAPLHVDLHFARVEAEVTVEGGQVVAMNGVLGGAVPKQQIKDGIQAMPDDQFPQGISKADLLALLDFMVQPDIDGDGDGVKESASLGIRFAAVPGDLVGVKPEGASAD